MQILRRKPRVSYLFIDRPLGGGERKKESNLSLFSSPLEKGGFERCFDEHFAVTIVSCFRHRKLGDDGKQKVVGIEDKNIPKMPKIKPNKHNSPTKGKKIFPRVIYFMVNLVCGNHLNLKLA